MKMWSKLGVFLFSLVFLLNLIASGSGVPGNSTKSKKEETLRLVFTIFRHGDRIQSNSYPKDPYINETYFPFGLAQLTNVGIERSYQLGRNLRKKYDNFLGAIYYGDIVHARSSDYSRTKATLMAVLAGMFPPHSLNVWSWSGHDELGMLWMPISFEFTPHTNDPIMLGEDCPNYAKLYDKYKETPDYQNTFNKYKDLFEYLLKYSGEDIWDMNRVRYPFLRFTFQETYGLLLPEWSAFIYPGLLTDALLDGYDVSSATPEMRKYLTGFFFKEMIEEIQKQKAGTLNKGRKIYLYSGHDINIAYTMISLGIMIGHAPQFCENITFEAHEMKGEYYIRIFHQVSTVEEPTIVKIQGCSEFCPFNDFVNYLSDILPGPDDTCSDKNC